MTLPPDPTEPTPGPGDADPATGRPEPTVGDSPVRRVFQRALRDMLVLVAALAVLGGAAGALLVDPPSAGIWGAALGVLVTLLFSGSTVLAMLLTARSSVTAASGALVGTWLVKMLVLIIAFSVLRDLDFYHRGVFVVVVMVGVLGSVLLDYRAVSTARVPYTDPGARR
jgi:hypothetical protein